MKTEKRNKKLNFFSPGDSEPASNPAAASCYTAAASVKLAVPAAVGYQAASPADDLLVAPHAADLVAPPAVDLPAAPVTSLGHGDAASSGGIGGTAGRCPATKRRRIVTVGGVVNAAYSSGKLS